MPLTVTAVPLGREALRAQLERAGAIVVPPEYVLLPLSVRCRRRPGSGCRGH